MVEFSGIGGMAGVFGGIKRNGAEFGSLDFDPGLGVQKRMGARRSFAYGQSSAVVRWDGRVQKVHGAVFHRPKAGCLRTKDDAANCLRDDSAGFIRPREVRTN